MSTSSRNRRYSSRGAAIVTIAMLICGMACSGRQPIVVRDDVSITNDVRARLAADAQANPLKINVDTKAGVVSLSGSVATDHDRNAVERIAREAPGVRSVDNNVRFGAAEVPAEPIVR